MNKKRITVLLAALAFSAIGCLSGCGGVASVKKGTPAEYASMDVSYLGDAVMPIGGFMGPNDLYVYNGYHYPSTITEAVYKKLGDCGINTIVDTKYDLATDTATVETALSLADKQGIGYIFRDSSLFTIGDTAEGCSVAAAEAFAPRLEELKAYKNLIGLYGRDEPNKTHFDAIKTANERFAAARTAADSDLFVYYNLFPSTTSAQLSGNTETNYGYDDYLADFMATEPDYLQYDMYPITGLPGSVNVGYLSLMGRIRAFAEKSGKAWWCYIQAGGDFMDTPGTHRIPTENELLWNVNTSLAYGAKGIFYFPLVQPPEWSAETDITKYALLNKFGETNAFYYYAQKANTQVAAVDGVLMRSANMGVILSGEGVAESAGSEIIKSGEFRQLKKVSGAAALVGCFDYEGGTALYVVNNSVAAGAQAITLEFDDTYRYDIVQRGDSVTAEAKTLTLKLQGGEGVLVTLA